MNPLVRLTGKSIISDAASIRGGMINDMAAIEEMIGQVIAEHFCYSLLLQTEFLDLFIYNSKLSFESKKQILNHLILKHYTDFQYNNALFLKNLEDIQKARNTFAHSEIDLSETGIKEYPAKIGFIKNRLNANNIIWFSDDDLMGLSDKCTYCIDALVRFLSRNRSVELAHLPPNLDVSDLPGNSPIS